MKHRGLRTWVGLLGFCVIWIYFSNLSGAVVKKDSGEWAGILKSNVSADGYVDYDGIRINKGGDLYEYLSMLEVADLTKMSEKEKTAFWINAYNAYLIKLILAQPALQKIAPADLVYEEKVKVAHWKVSLGLIKNRALRLDPEMGGGVAELSIAKFDPLIHFAICDGVVGSASLRRMPYSGIKIEEELQEAARNFINDSRKIYVKDGKLVMSAIFSRYAKDFDAAGGVPAVVKTYLDPKARADAPQILELLAQGFPGTIVFEFDETLNSVKLKQP